MAKSLFVGAIPLITNEPSLLTLSLDEFLRRFLLHILPQGFVRIRHFGFLANRKRAKTLPLCFHALGATSPPSTRSEPASPSSGDTWHCPECGGLMVVVEKLSVVEIQFRSPPEVTAAA